MLSSLPLLIVLAYVAVRALQFTWLRARNQTVAVDANMLARGDTLVLPQWFRQWAVWAAEPILSALLRLKVSPNSITMASLALTGLAGGFIFKGMLLLGGQFVLLGACLDYLDGRLARTLGIASPAGAFLDSVVDRLGEAIVLLAAALLFSDSKVTMAASIVILASGNLVSYSRAKAESLGHELGGGLMQRGERALILALAAIADGIGAQIGYDPPPFVSYFATTYSVFATAIVCMAAMTALTAISRIIRGYRGLCQKE